MLVLAVMAKPHDGLLTRHGIQHGVWNLIHTPCCQGPGTSSMLQAYPLLLQSLSYCSGPRCWVTKLSMRPVHVQLYCGPGCTPLD